MIQIPPELLDQFERGNVLLFIGERIGRDAEADDDRHEAATGGSRRGRERLPVPVRQPRASNCCRRPPTLSSISFRFVVSLFANDISCSCLNLGEMRGTHSPNPCD